MQEGAPLLPGGGVTREGALRASDHGSTEPSPVGTRGGLGMWLPWAQKRGVPHLGPEPSLVPLAGRAEGRKAGLRSNRPSTKQKPSLGQIAEARVLAQPQATVGAQRMSVKEETKAGQRAKGGDTASLRGPTSSSASPTAEGKCPLHTPTSSTQRVHWNCKRRPNMPVASHVPVFWCTVILILEAEKPREAK